LEAPFARKNIYVVLAIENNEFKINKLDEASIFCEFLKERSLGHPKWHSSEVALILI